MLHEIQTRSHILDLYIKYFNFKPKIEIGMKNGQSICYIDYKFIAKNGISRSQHYNTDTFRLLSLLHDMAQTKVIKSEGRRR